MHEYQRRFELAVSSHQFERFGVGANGDHGRCTIAHDDHCRIYKGMECNCDPTVLVTFAGRKFIVDANGWVDEVTLKPSVVLCEECFPAERAEQCEIKTIVPLTPCVACGKSDQRHAGGLRAHLFTSDPRP